MTDDASISRLSGLVDDLGLVIPPQVAAALISPLLVLEALIGAVFDSGRAMLGPGIVLLLGVMWIANESRIVELVGGRRSEQQGVEA